MQNPDNPAEEQYREPAVTGIFNGAGNVPASVRADPAVPPPEPYVREPLFNKKAMAAWAIAAFVVWFGVTFIAPPVIRSIGREIVRSVEDYNDNGGRKITIKRDGKTVISVDTDNEKAPAIVVEPTPPAPPAGAPAAAPATPKR